MFHILLSPHTHLICLPTQTTVSRLRQSEVNNMDVVMSLFSFAVNVWVGLGGGGCNPFKTRWRNPLHMEGAACIPECVRCNHPESGPLIQLGVRVLWSLPEWLHREALELSSSTKNHSKLQRTLPYLKWVNSASLVERPILLRRKAHFEWVLQFGLRAPSQERSKVVMYSTACVKNLEIFENTVIA